MCFYSWWTWVLYLAFLQISTQAGWLRSWALIFWCRLGRPKVESCPPTAHCRGTPWTSRGLCFRHRSSSNLITTTQSGVCHRLMRTRWSAWGIWTGSRLRCYVAEGWSAPTTLWFTRPSERQWTGTLAAKQDWIITEDYSVIIHLQCTQLNMKFTILDFKNLSYKHQLNLF